MNTRGEGVWGKPDGWNWRGRPGPEDRAQRDKGRGTDAPASRLVSRRPGTRYAAHLARPSGAVLTPPRRGVQRPECRQAERPAASGQRPDVTEAHRLFHSGPPSEGLSIMSLRRGPEVTSCAWLKHGRRDPATTAGQGPRTKISVSKENRLPVIGYGHWRCHSVPASMLPRPTKGGGG